MREHMSKGVLLCLILIVVVSGGVYFNALFNEFVFAGNNFTANGFTEVLYTDRYRKLSEVDDCHAG